MQLSENAHRVLQARYLRRNAHGKVSETPDQLFTRVARAIVHAGLLLGNWEQSALWEERFYRLLTSLDFLPNSSTLMNAGTPLGQLSACLCCPWKIAWSPSLLPSVIWRWYNVPVGAPGLASVGSVPQVT